MSDNNNNRVVKPEQRPQAHPGQEQKGAVTDALVQTVKDLKEVGLGALGAALVAPKAPPKDE